MVDLEGGIARLGGQVCVEEVTMNEQGLIDWVAAKVVADAHACWAKKAAENGGFL